jgi:hypothetical protein
MMAIRTIKGRRRQFKDQECVGVSTYEKKNRKKHISKRGLLSFVGNNVCLLEPQ